VVVTLIGTGNSTVPTCGAGTAAQQARVTLDMTEWRDLLLGASEKSSGANVGAVLGARGCVSKDPSSNLYLVTVAWQGSAAITAPPAGVTCGQGLYGDDAARRAVSVTVELS
jgi:type IV pilus assembly protein PilV